MTDPRDATRRARGPGDDVTASKVGTYIFCAKAWHLEHVLGKRPSIVAAQRRAAGVAEHDAHEARVVALHQTGRGLARWVAALLMLARRCSSPSASSPAGADVARAGATPRAT